MPRGSSVGSLRLRPADAFDLIRWLARSQSDPRKAVAELVQNSLDARASQIRVERRRLRGTPALIVCDDGEGVLPEMERVDALRWIATHIGHSRKLGLSPVERRERVVAGKYGVGILGFWAIGKRFEMRSRVAGSELHALRLVEDNPRADIVRLPSRLDAAETFTEVAVSGIHDAALRPLSGRRLAEYLAAELRGQLLGRDVGLVVHDGMARGSAQKLFRVVPRRFVGERLDLPAEIEAAGHSPLRVELYLASGLERPAIQVACAGTLVADDVGELTALGLAERPWVGCELTGLIDFPDFAIPPGTRRGVTPDRAAVAFVRAMERLRPLVEAELSRLQRERQAAADREVVSQLRRALRGLGRRLPHYELPPVSAGAEEAPQRGDAPGEAVGAQGEDDEAEAPELFPAGPMASVSIVPSLVRIAPGEERRVRAVPRDAAGRKVDAAMSLSWTIRGAGLSVEGEGARAELRADAAAPIGSKGQLRVEATQDGLSVSADAVVLVAERDEPDGGLGIPEPELVDDPGAGWRSRHDGVRWQVNQAHEDYVALRGDPRARLRYLLALLAKEIVQRSYGQPGGEALLERLVEVLAHAERNLRGG